MAHPGAEDPSRTEDKRRPTATRAQAPGCRPRRQPHPVRTFGRRLRRGLGTRTCSPPRPGRSGWTGSAWRAAAGAVIGGAVLKHSRDFNSMRESVLGSPRPPTPRDRSPAGMRHRPAGRPSPPPTGSPPAVTRSRPVGRHHLGRPIGRSATTYAAPCSGCAAPNPTRPPQAGRQTARRRRRGDPHQRRTPHRTVDGRARRHHRQEDGHQASRSGRSWPPPVTATWPPPTIGASSTIWSPLFPGALPRQQPAGGLQRREARPLKPVFGVRNGDATMTGGNSPLTDGASVALLASEDWPPPIRCSRWPLRRRRDGGGRLRQRPRRPADGAHLRGPAAFGPQRADPAGLRLLRDPRGVRLGGAGPPAGLGVRGVPQGAAGLDAALGSIDRTRLNVNGSSLAAGHPFAATGADRRPAGPQLAQKKAETVLRCAD